MSCSLKRSAIKQLAFMAIIVAALFAGALFAAPAATAHAATVEATKVVIPVSQVCEPTGSLEVEYTLEPSLPSNPLPEGSDDDGFTFSLAGSSVRDIVVPVGAPGIYEYSLYCSSDPIEGWDLPTDSFLVRLFVINDGDNGLDSAVVIVGEDGSKSTSAKFAISAHKVINPSNPDNPDNPYNPSNPSNPSKPTKSPIEQMGDTFQIWVPIAAVVLAGLLIVILSVRHRRKDS